MTTTADLLRDLHEANLREYDRQRMGALVAEYLAPISRSEPEPAIACDGAVVAEPLPLGARSGSVQAAGRSGAPSGTGRLFQQASPGALT